MFLRNVKIRNYKNLSDIELVLSAKINCFVGQNGAGKTNFIDAIHFLSNTRSYFNHIDSHNVRRDEKFFYIEGVFQKKDSRNQVIATYSEDKGKQFKVDTKRRKKLSEHYGEFPVVMITPYDVNLILDGSELRRNFVDSIIAIYDKEYLQNIISYKKILVQRNALLKKFALEKFYQEEFIEIFDFKLQKLAPLIFQKRQEFLRNFTPIFQDYYIKISGIDEQIDLIYKSDLIDDSMQELLSQNRQKDIALTRTSAGIHKDDLIFQINGFSLKKAGSQGQQKTYLTALKFAQSDYIKRYAGIRPILLLDDIFDKLDASRVAKVVELVSDNHFGQIFITHTDIEKLNEILKPVTENFSVFEVNNGEIQKLDGYGER